MTKKKDGTERIAFLFISSFFLTFVSVHFLLWYKATFDLLNDNTLERSKDYQGNAISTILSYRYLCKSYNDGRIIGGLLAILCWNWIEVDIFWIETSQRGKGYGTRLINKIENIANEKCCAFIKLNTFSFQAPEFYIKHGYKEVAVFEDVPLGSNHYYFKKVIA